MGSDGVGGVYALDPWPAVLRLPPADGVEGVMGKDPSRDGGVPRFVALFIGRNIPAPGIEVVK